MGSFGSQFPLGFDFEALFAPPGSVVAHAIADDPLPGGGRFGWWRFEEHYWFLVLRGVHRERAEVAGRVPTHHSELLLTEQG